ncbi:Biofilm dispersion protein BdlA [Vibrio aerogenes CECT 7868]|uniref:Biofilm dispersion protein BdlA n=1 Tax=Vibrio aerogenes CECT 7868 TaxID=1216006 RepID=A0A1M5XJS9_9VIBR|nr:Biofilm dispersion protein BdlA [Vibrio aerogenes CECT 7868]
MVLLSKPNESDPHLLREEVERLKILYQRDINELSAELELKESEINTLLLYEELKDRLRVNSPTDEFLLNQICNGIAVTSDSSSYQGIQQVDSHEMQSSYHAIQQLMQKLNGSILQPNMTSLCEEIIEPFHEMLNAVEEISSQINLLALNTVIEAAKSGDNGQRLAFIADEVSTLAQQAHKISFELENFIQDTFRASGLALHL